MDRSLELQVAGGAVILVRAMAMSDAQHRRIFRAEGRHAMIVLRHQPGWVARFRRWREADRLVPGLSHYSDPDVANATERAVVEGRLLAVFVPHSPIPSATGEPQKVAARAVLPPFQALANNAKPLSDAQKADAAIAQMSPVDRAKEAWTRATTLKVMTEEAGRFLRQLIERGLVEIVLISAGVAVASFAYPPAAIAILLICAFAFGWQAGGDIVKLFDATRRAAGATDDATINRTAQEIAQLIVDLSGMAFLLLLAKRLPLRERPIARIGPAASVEAYVPPSDVASIPRRIIQPNLSEPEIAGAAETAEAEGVAGMQALNRTKALEFYIKQAGFSEENALQHIDGIDLAQPVTVTTLDTGTTLQQYVGARGLGNYFAPVGTTPLECGLAVTDQTLTILKNAQPVQALQSIAKPGYIYPPGAIVPGSGAGGGTQFFIPNKTAFVPTGGQ
jgi:hypothetical protein